MFVCYRRGSWNICRCLAGMNRHHYSLFLHNCRLVLLLRREPRQGVDMNVFQPAEWRWRLDEICDGKWHHYSINMDYPQVGQGGSLDILWLFYCNFFVSLPARQSVVHCDLFITWLFNEVPVRVHSTDACRDMTIFILVWTSFGNIICWA